MDHNQEVKMQFKKIFMFCALVLMWHYSFEVLSMEHKDSSSVSSKASSMNIRASDMLAGFGSIVGFGLGHAARGHWKERGWIFTALEGFMVVYLADQGVGHGTTLFQNQNVLLFFLGFKVFQIVDVIMISLKIAKKESPFQFSPLLSYQKQNGYDLGLALKYRF